MKELKFLKENIRRQLIKEYLISEIGDAGFGGVEIQRTPQNTIVMLKVERPGLVIGRRGSKIKNMETTLEKRFNLTSPLIKVEGTEQPGLNAQIMAQKLARSIEKGWHFRRAGHSILKRIMDSGARGGQVRMGGKLTGERSRSVKYTAGKVISSGFPSEKIEKGFAVALTKPGIIGVYVKILRNDVKLPDDIKVGKIKLEEVTGVGGNEGKVDTQNE
ncbi:MAG: 30S ribosomal protein S3 [Candidatus Thermoplasmatota archaeon]|jgi:small subunit ribosomal protein S3|nr:30S ribosomal protein S3 [Candidatus Thermoplasmatota archaeon]